jgi:hypothetical protein
MSFLTGLVMLYRLSIGLHFFSKRGVPASASIDVYGFLLKLLRYPHYYSSRIREDRYMNQPSKNTARPM